MADMCQRGGVLYREHIIRRTQIYTQLRELK